MHPFFNILRLKGLPLFWTLAMISAFGQVVLHLGELFKSMTATQVGWGQINTVLVAILFIVLIALFGTGDSRLLKIQKDAEARQRSRQPRMKKSQMPLIDWTLLPVHAGFFNVLAFVWPTNLQMFFELMVGLAALNVLWLLLKTRHFHALMKHERKTAYRNELHSGCDAMLNWCTINTTYLLGTIAALFASSRGLIPPSYVVPVCMILFMLRSLADVVVGWTFYHEALEDDDLDDES